MTLTVPAEWAPHRAMWLGFPSHAELWEDDLAAAQAEVAALARALAGPGGERVRLMTGSARARRTPRRAAGRRRRASRSSPAPFGDIWLRDTGPIFARRRRRAAGGQASASTAGAASTCWSATTRSPSRSPRRPARRWSRHDFVLEGGALDHDGEGTVLTTGQCLLNPNRNPGWTRGRRRGRACAEALGATQGAVAGRGPAQRPHRRPRRQPGPLRRARASSPARSPSAATTPTPRSMTTPPGAWPAMTDARRRAAAGDAHPLAGLDRRTRTARPIPASHMNFLIANGAVIVPIYEEQAGRLRRARRWSSLFPEPPGDRPAVARHPHRRRLVPLHHPAGARLMARTA